ncbi:hypothetical protein [Metarhizobium album]|uniref:hypothetical protein n=1 Tax=Metarhizobium album TaxID=2182425 RepID=UPI0014026CE7|nr:hypothetical protein [Rhizobium album]
MWTGSMMMSGGVPILPYPAVNLTPGTMPDGEIGYSTGAGGDYPARGSISGQPIPVTGVTLIDFVREGPSSTWVHFATPSVGYDFLSLVSGRKLYVNGVGYSPSNPWQLYGPATWRAYFPTAALVAGTVYSIQLGP